jgi:hypothetical protein
LNLPLEGNFWVFSAAPVIALIAIGLPNPVWSAQKKIIRDYGYFSVRRALFNHQDQRVPDLNRGGREREVK